MSSPDQRLFEADLQSAEFRMGVLDRRWGEAELEAMPAGAAWPKRFFWIAAAKRDGAPERFYLALDLSGYRSVAPTGPFWDPVKKATLELAKWPKGRPNSGVASVFKTSAFTGAGNALYHPYDRVGSHNHGQWPAQMPQRVWTDKHTIADYLSEMYSLLNSGDYIGI
jgi:hypothetical protein